jgi:peptidoglycan/xylan/chitin deacetylase (PgdA/CDA1 family)
VIVAPVAAGLAAVAGTLAWGVYEPNSPLFGPVIGHGADDAVYLSFDDGPSADTTPVVLDVLARDGAPAAFFMVGRHARTLPDLTRAAAGAGHLIGNHTDTHVKLHVRSPARIARELADAHQTLAELTGRAPAAFRAPHGYRNPFVRTAARRLGYSVFGWSFGVWDTARPGAETIRHRVRTRLRPGAIVLLHDGDGYDPHGDRSQTAAALPGIIRDIRDAGYRIAPLAELLP